MPTFLKTLFNWASGRSKGVSQILSSISRDPFAIWTSGKRIPAHKAMEVYAGWVYACIRAIAEELANMKFRLYKVGSDQDVKEVFDHELLDLLGGVNNFQTGYELKYMSGAHLESTGNCYWYLQGVKNETDKPKAIFILNPAKVRTVLDKTTFPNVLKGYEYTDQGKRYEFKPYEVLNLKYPDPSDPYEGIGTVQCIAQWIDADNYAMEFNRRFFLNGARIGGFVESENAVTEAQLKYLKKQFEAIHQGVDNAYKTLALPKGTKYQPASENQKDMDFSNLATMMRDRILAGFRVPRTALGITDDVNRANAEATDYVFALRTIKPKMQLIVSYLNEFLVPRFGNDIYLDFEDPVPENRELAIQEMQASLGNQPSLSVNEAREKYFGAEPVEGGDSVKVIGLVTNLGAPKPADAGKGAGRNGKKAAGEGRLSTRYTKNAKMRKSITDQLADAAIKALEQTKIEHEEVKKKSIEEMTDADWEIVWKAFVVRVQPYEDKMAEAIREVNLRQKEEVLQNLPKVLPKSISAKALDPETLLDRPAAIKLTFDLSQPILTDLAQKEGKEAAQLLGISELDILANPEVKRALDRAIELMSESYTDTTLGLLKSKLEDGISAGLGQQEMADLVSTIYEFSDTTRAAQVSRTEVFRVANDANTEAWKQSGVETRKWYTAADERVCPYCAPMNGKILGIDENFFNRGDTVEGSDGSTLPIDYSDVKSPPLHVSCRCYTRPEKITLD